MKVPLRLQIRPLLRPEIAELIGDLPDDIAGEIITLVEEFYRRQPDVVHAWQDSTSIKAGIAAVIAGVPRIVLASRNVIPKNFTYYKEYMRPAYRALASHKSVVLVNNSEVGTRDYTRWLDLPRDRFKVVRNGVDLKGLARASEDVVRDYKQSIDIPSRAKVVGSIFRFWAEKRPMLWLETAVELSKSYPDLHFLLIGDGPMRNEMNAYIFNHSLGTKIHLPGARTDIAIPLSSMNVFVLTSEYEGTPNVVLEAQWLGVPVVVADAGGAKESFAHGESGLLSTQNSAQEICTLVSFILNNDRFAEEAKLAGPRYVKKEFGIERMVKETMNLYDGGEEE